MWRGGEQLLAVTPGLALRPLLCVLGQGQCGDKASGAGTS